MSGETEENSPLIDNRHDCELSVGTPVVDAIPVLEATIEASPYIPPVLPATATTEKLEEKVEKVKEQSNQNFEAQKEEISPLIPPPTSTQEEKSTTSTVPFVPDDLGRESVEITCPYCKKSGLTEVSTEISFMTLMYIILSLVIFFPAIIVVCFSKKLKDSIHRCRYCIRIVGKTDSFSDCL